MCLVAQAHLNQCILTSTFFFTCNDAEQLRTAQEHAPELLALGEVLRGAVREAAAVLEGGAPEHRALREVLRRSVGQLEVERKDDRPGSQFAILTDRHSFEYVRRDLHKQLSTS